MTTNPDKNGTRKEHSRPISLMKIAVKILSRIWVNRIKERMRKKNYVVASVSAEEQMIAFNIHERLKKKILTAHKERISVIMKIIYLQKQTNLQQILNLMMKY